jgi:hypothetical protein
MKVCGCDREREASPFIPIVVSIVAAILWAAFMLLHILFWSSNFDWLQNLAIIVLSLVIMGCIVGLMWVFWVFKRA